MVAPTTAGRLISAAACINRTGAGAGKCLVARRRLRSCIDNVATSTSGLALRRS